MDPVEKKEIKANKKHYDRITLLPQNIETVAKLKSQVSEEYPSLPDFQLKDMVNLFLEIRSDLFSKQELIQIYRKLFDPVKVMRLATQDLIEAKKNGIQLSLQEAIKKYETPSVSKNLGKPNRLSRTKNSNGSGDLHDDELSNTDPTPSSETANFDRIKRPRKSATSNQSEVLLNENNRIENDEK